MFTKSALLGNCEMSPVFTCETGLDFTDSILRLPVQNRNMQLIKFTIIE